jgi:hypothetical protein
VEGQAVVGRRNPKGLVEVEAGAVLVLLVQAITPAQPAALPRLVAVLFQERVGVAQLLLLLLYHP